MNWLFYKLSSIEFSTTVKLLIFTIFSVALNKPENEDSSSEEGKNNRSSQQRSSSTDRSGWATCFLKLVGYD